MPDVPSRRSVANVQEPVGLQRRWQNGRNAARLRPAARLRSAARLRPATRLWSTARLRSATPRYALATGLRAPSPTRLWPASTTGLRSAPAIQCRAASAELPAVAAVRFSLAATVSVWSAAIEQSGRFPGVVRPRRQAFLRWSAARKPGRDEMPGFTPHGIVADLPDVPADRTRRPRGFAAALGGYASA
jgi:hypothetical protein